MTFPSARGAGIGLRPEHYGFVLGRRPAVPWFEAVSENYMGLRGGPGEGGRPLEVLERVRADYPVALHGVSLNVGSSDPLDRTYLKRLKALVDRIEPWAVSDHLCWTGVGGQNLHDLLPLPYTEEAVRHVGARLARVQDALGRRFLVENVSSYLSFEHSGMTEWEFLTRVAEEADCGILLDVNNIHVSAVNHGFDPLLYLNGVPKERVAQMHLAGYSDAGDLLIDTHDHPVTPPVWRLYEKALERFGQVPTLVEWDENIPPFPRLETERRKAQRLMDRHAQIPVTA